MMTLLTRLIFFILLTHTSYAYSDFFSKKKSELQHVNGQIQTIQNTLLQKQKQQHNLQQQLETTEIELGKLSQEINHINQALLKEEKEDIRLNKQYAVLKNKLSQQINTLAKQIHAAYQLGKNNEIKILLNQENPNTLSRHLRYYRYLTENRLDLITSIKQTLTTLTNTMQTINEHQHNLQQLFSQKQRQQLAQQLAQRSRQQFITQSQQDMLSKKQQLAVLLENQKTLQDTLNHLQIGLLSLADNKPFSTLQGKLLWPVKGPIIANFGSPLDVGEQHLSGVIIKASNGTPIRAIYGGKVVFANWLRGFGLLVIINHGNGYMSLYARNQELATKVGDTLKQGDIVATAGNTGGYLNSGLYFEIRRNGVPVNPNLWCRYT